jgi:hypothetical protein
MRARLRWHGSLGWSNCEFDFTGVTVIEIGGIRLTIRSNCAAIYVRILLLTRRSENGMSTYVNLLPRQRPLDNL